MKMKLLTLSISALFAIGCIYGLLTAFSKNQETDYQKFCKWYQNHKVVIFVTEENK
jgi:hypothetical protein